MKPCDQTCPKCGAFPVNLDFRAEVTEKMAERHKKQAEIYSKMGSFGFIFAGRLETVPMPAIIVCRCPRCSHYWTVKPMDAEVSNDP